MIYKLILDMLDIYYGGERIEVKGLKYYMDEVSPFTIEFYNNLSFSMVEKLNEQASKIMADSVCSNCKVNRLIA